MTPSQFSILLALVVGGLSGHVATRVWWEREHPVPAEVRESESPTRAYARGIEIPVVDFEQASLEEVVDFLRGQTRTGIELSDGPRPFRLNFIVLDPEGTARRIDLRMRRVQLDQLCERIAQAAGVGVSFDSDAIVFTSLQSAGKANPAMGPR